MQEIWKKIENFNGYEVSSYGRIRSYWTSGNKWRPHKISSMFRILKPYKMGNYLGIQLGRNNRHYIHRLVATMFIPNINNYAEVNHINFNKYDNNISNLEWVTSKQNQIHKKNAYRQPSGEKCYNSKLNWTIVDQIRTSNEKGYIISKRLGISQNDICRIRKLKRWHPSNRILKNP